MRYFFIALFVSFSNFILKAQIQTNIAGPENVLVVYNSSDSNSESIANYYKVARNIPDENLLPLNLPYTVVIGGHTILLGDQNEVIVDQNGNTDQNPSSIYNNSMQFVKEYITQPIEDYLNNNVISGDLLANRIRFIVVCKGIPLKATSWVADWSHVSDISRRGVSVDALISIINQSNPDFSITNSSFITAGITNSMYNNPYHAIEDLDGSEYNFNYRFKTKTYINDSGIELNYLVSRLDGYDYDDVISMIERSTNPDISGQSVFVLDGDLTSYTGKDVSTCRADVHNAEVALNGLDFIYDENETDDLILNSSGTCMGYESSGSHSDSLLFADYCVDLFEFNYANGAIFNTYESFNGYAFDISNLGDNEIDFGKRQANVMPTYLQYQGLIADFIHAGGTGGESHVYEPTTSTISQGKYFFPAYAMGYSLVESIYMGIPYIASRNLVVGDPLTTIAWGKQTTTQNINMSGTNLITGDITISDGDTIILASGSTIMLKYNGFIESDGYGVLQLKGSVTVTSDSWSRGLLLADYQDHPQLVWSDYPTGPSNYYKIYKKLDSGSWQYVDSVRAHSWTDNSLVYSDHIGQLPNIVYYYVKLNGTQTSNTVDAEVNKSRAKNLSPVTNPISYKLEQNYPNPFNPSTTINYSIKNDGFVSLKVYNILGQQVADLVNQNQKAGYYNVNFNAANLTSGVYIYTISSSEFTSSKKMLLIK